MKAIVLRPGEGRPYPMGRISALFKADGDETGGRCSISEWWLEPNTKGPGPHAHEAEDSVFYVIEGTMSILAGDRAVVRGKSAEGRAAMTHRSRICAVLMAR